MTSQTLLQKHARIRNLLNGKGAVPFFKPYVYLSAALAVMVDYRVSQRPQKSCLILVLSLLYASVSHSATVNPVTYAYTVQGILELKAVRYSMEHKSFFYEPLRYTFDVSVSGHQWMIKLGTHDPKVYDYRVVSSDGDDTYLLLSYETRRLVSPKSSGWNVGDGTVARGNVPCFAIADEAGAVWIAYASASYFAQPASGQRRQVPFANYVGQRNLMPGDKAVLERVSFSLEDEPPQLPKEAAYYVQDFSKEWIEPRVKINADGPFTNVIYEAMSFTNLGRLRLPTKSRVAVYRPDPQLLPKVVPQTCYEIHLTTTNIVLETSLVSFKPKLPGPTVISEQRFNNGTGINFAYRATNNWPSEEAARQSPGYREARQIALTELAAKKKNMGTFVRIVIIGTLIALPAVVWLLSRSRRHDRPIGNPTTTQTQK